MKFDDSYISDDKLIKFTDYMKIDDKTI